MSECHECLDLRLAMESNKRGVSMSRRGVALALITGGSALALSALCLPFVSPALRRVCLPFVPATDKQMENVFTVLNRQLKLTSTSKKTFKLLDIGSGDGRIVLEAARRGFDAHGIELNAWLVLYSKWTSWRRGVRAKFIRADLWKFDCKQYDVIVVFGVEAMMTELESKLRRELRPRSLIVTCRFHLPNTKALCTEGVGIDTVSLYNNLGQGTSQC